jgi:flavin reductase (DIM6/NTAB) family NADH-FMN oxidoreductase RutF
MGDLFQSAQLQDAFKAAMRRLASGVAVVAMQSPGGPVGMAATSVTSLTFDPMAILFCVNKAAGFHTHIAIGSPVCVNILSRAQQAISAAFGSSASRDERFRAGVWEADLRGSPMLAGAQCNLSCTIDTVAPYGTHSIVIASVEAVRVHEAVDPLIFIDGGYL